MNITEGSINDKISLTCYGLEVKEDQGVIKLGPSKADSGVFLVSEEGPLGIVATNDKLTINYGGQYLLEIESSEDRGHIISILSQQQDQKHTIKANECEDGIEKVFDEGRVIFDEEGRKLILSIEDEEVGLKISLQVDGFEEKRKLKYSEVHGKHTFRVEMKSRSEMNQEEINRVEQEFLDANRSGVRSASMGIGRSAVAGAITRSFGVFRENGLQVVRNGTPVIELKAQ